MKHSVGRASSRSVWSHIGNFLFLLPIALFMALPFLEKCLRRAAARRILENYCCLDSR